MQRLVKDFYQALAAKLHGKFGHWRCPPKLFANSQSINPRSDIHVVSFHMRFNSMKSGLRRIVCTKKASPIPTLEPVLRVWLTRPMKSEKFGCPLPEVLA